MKPPYAERGMVFECAGDELVGVLSFPPESVAERAAVLIVVGGPQYRVGAHRLFVELARTLAAEGHVVLRFDYRGMGDSSGAQRDFRAVSEDIGQALGVLLAHAPKASRLVLFGLCDAASACLLYLHETRDARVTGLCLLNPWVRSEASLAQTHLKHYYGRRLLQVDFWQKLLTGGVRLNRASEFTRSLKLSLASRTSNAKNDSARGLPFQRAMASAWRQFKGSILLALSDDDLTAKEFVQYAANQVDWHELLSRSNVERVSLPGADHTLSGPRDRLGLEQALLRWLSPQ